MIFKQIRKTFNFIFLSCWLVKELMFWSTHQNLFSVIHKVKHCFLLEGIFWDLIGVFLPADILVNWGKLLNIFANCDMMLCLIPCGSYCCAVLQLVYLEHTTSSKNEVNLFIFNDVVIRMWPLVGTQLFWLEHANLMPCWQSDVNHTSTLSEAAQASFSLFPLLVLTATSVKK